MRLVALFGGLLTAFALSAQSTAAPPAGAVTQLVVIVDGSKNPEQIPDNLAYKHFLMAVATHEQPVPEEQKRQEAFLKDVGLSGSDEKTIALALGKMTTQLEAIQAARVASDGAPASLVALKAQEDALISGVITQVRQALTSEGQLSLNQYVTGTVKKNIKIYGLPNN
jgi:hypothetical protein